MVAYSYLLVRRRVESRPPALHHTRPPFSSLLLPSPFISTLPRNSLNAIIPVEHCPRLAQSGIPLLARLISPIQRSSPVLAWSGSILCLIQVTPSVGPGLALVVVEPRAEPPSVLDGTQGQASPLRCLCSLFAVLAARFHPLFFFPSSISMTGAWIAMRARIPASPSHRQHSKVHVVLMTEMVVKPNLGCSRDP